MKQAKNKEQIYDQDTETYCLAFEVRSEVKDPETQFLFKSWNLAVQVFEAINKA